MLAIKRCSSISSIFCCVVKNLNLGRLTQLHRVKKNSGIMKSGRIKSDDLGDWCYLQIWIRCGDDWNHVGWMLRQECTLNVDTNVHVFLSNIELRQNE